MSFFPTFSAILSVFQQPFFFLCYNKYMLMQVRQVYVMASVMSINVYGEYIIFFTN